MSKRIIIVQNRPTQFDVPLYAMVHRDSEFNIVVFYTQVAPFDTNAIDPETVIAPQWDHLQGVYYPARFESSVISLWKQIMALQPDHVIICGWYPRSHALLALLLRLCNIRIGVRSDNTLEHTSLSGFSGWLKRCVMFIWLGLYNAWHPVGSMAKAYVEKLSAIKRPVYYFSYAVDVDWFAKQSIDYRKQRSKLRKKLGFEESDFVILGVLKWVEREDPLTLVNAFLKASQEQPNIKLLLVGNGHLKEKIERRFAQEPNRLIAPGYAKYSELPLYYAISDLFVHPAQSEPYGVSVQEAMACGLPVILSNKVGAGVDFLESERTGDIFPVGDLDRLAELLILYSRKQPDESNRKYALQKALEWSYERTINEWRLCLEARL